MCPVASSDVSSLCTVLCQSISLKLLELDDTDLTRHEAKELASALEQNRSLEVVFINEDSVTITDDGVRILRQVLRNHPTVKEIEPKSDHNSLTSDDNLQLRI